MGDTLPAAKAVPLTCHGHSRPITHLNFSSSGNAEDGYYLVSASKDNTPQLRNGLTGDWIGTFLGHKGAVWSSRVSSTGLYAVTGSADFTAKVWDATTGELKHTLAHDHIVRAVALAPGPEPGMIATGGHEKKLRIWDLNANSGVSNPAASVTSYEIGAGVHQSTIKSIVWSPETDLLITGGEDKVIRWWDMRQQNPAASVTVDGPFGTCELTTKTSNTVLTVAAGKKAYFFSGQQPGKLLKSHTLSKDVSSVAINWEQRQFVAGSSADTWVRIYDYETGDELDVCKGHHGPVWTTAFSPDGNLYATGSEDGTIKLWKFCKEPYGMWKGGTLSEAVAE